LNATLALQEEIRMNAEDMQRPSGETPTRRENLIIALLSLGLLLLLGALVVWSRGRSPAPAASGATASVQYHKKELVYKRTLAQADTADIRASALSAGYQALAAIPSALVTSQVSIRSPQFLNVQDLTNFNSLSALGSAQYYANENVRQYLSNLNAQQYFSDLNQQIYMNNLQNQQYLNNLNSPNNPYSPMNLYANNLNSPYNPTNLQFNNFNSPYSPTNLNNWNTYTPPSFYQPPQLSIPPSIYVPPPTFNTWP
jgi:hypothetical protein